MGRLVHCSDVTHDGSPLTASTTVDWSEQGRVVPLAPGDAAMWSPGTLVTDRSCTFSVGFLDDDSLQDADIALGADGSLVAHGKDPAGGGDSVLTILNCVILSKGGNLGSGAEAGFTISGEAYSADGTTTPASMA